MHIVSVADLVSQHVVNLSPWLGLYFLVVWLWDKEIHFVEEN
jgi:hypothetical protein